MRKDMWKRLVDIFIVMAKIGCFTFGGGWSIIGQMQNEFVEKRGWMTEEQIVDFMSLAKSFPGVMVINMSVLSGYVMAGVPGALAAAFGLSAPALVAIALVAHFYEVLKDNLYVEKILSGVRCVVIPIMLNAAWKLKKTALSSGISYVLLGIAFVICTFTKMNKLILVVLSAVAGLLIWRGDVADDAG